MKKLYTNVLLKPRTLFFIEFMLFSSINSRFNSLLFLELGLNTSEIGIILAIYSIFAILAGPVWTLLADKLENPPLILLICSVGATISFLSYSFARVFSHFLLVRCIFSIFFPPIASLMDAIGLNAFTNENDDISVKQAAYGRERLWGAISWALTHIMLGILMDLLQATSTILYVFSVINSCLFITILMYTMKQRNGAGGNNDMNRNETNGNNTAVVEKNLTMKDHEDQDTDIDTVVLINKNVGSNDNSSDEEITNRNNNVEMLQAMKIIFCRNIYSVIFFIDVTILGMATSLVEGLVFIFFVNDLHASKSLCGISVLITVLFEIPIFYYSDYIVKFFPNHVLMGIAHVAYVIRVVGYTIVPNPWWLLLLEPLHGVTYACFQLSSVAIASNLATTKLQSTAQGLRSACLNLGAAVGYIIGGYIMQNYDSNTLYRVMAGIIFFALVLYIASSYCFKNDKTHVINEESNVKRNQEIAFRNFETPKKKIVVPIVQSEDPI
jgi:MFS family permease